MKSLFKILFSVVLISMFLPVVGSPAMAGSNPTVTSVAAGNTSSYVVRSDGTVWGWGDNASGQLGTSVGSYTLTPIQISGLSNVKSVAAGYLDTLALKSDGTVWGLGYDTMGQLGNDSTTTTSVAQAVYGLSNVQEIAAGGVFSLALKSDGTVWAWGDDEQDQLGVDWTSSSSGLSNYYSSVPIQVPGLPTITQIAAGNDFALALTSSGTVWGWGDSYNGQIGTQTNNLLPTQISGVSNVTQVAAGYDASYALESDGTVWAWGNNTEYQLGNTGAQNQSTPVKVSGLSNVVAISASDGGNHVVALESNGTLWSWGDNSSGELGSGSSATQIATPVEATGLQGVSSVAAGADFSVVAKSDGTLWAWGNNTDGQVGTGYSNVPILVETPFDAHLKSLTGFTGLSFNPDTFTYSITAPVGTTGVTYTPTADNPSATIHVNNTPTAFTSGEQLTTTGLSYGMNTIAITVTSADQSENLTYTINIMVPLPPISFSQSTYSVQAGGSVTVSGVTYDVYNNPLANATINLTAPIGSWTVTGSTYDTVTTNVYGNFSDTWMAPTTPGTYTLSASGNNSSATTTVSVYSPPSTSSGSGGSSGGTPSGSTGGSSSTGGTSGSSGSPSDSSGGSSSGSSGGSNSGSSSNDSTGTSFNLPGIMMYGTVDSSGDKQSFPDGNSTVSINIPQGAFPNPEYLSVTTGTALDVGSEVSGLPTASVPLILGVNFAGPAPQKPITLTIQNPAIVPGTVVYKLMSDGTLQPVPATVTNGQIQVSFTSDPDFVLMTVKSNQRVITMAHHTSVVPAVVHKDGTTSTTYMPIWYVMQLLQALGVSDKWDGHNWFLTTASGTKADLSVLSPGHGSMSMYINGTLVQELDGLYAKDPSTGKATTYMPIWYVMKMLKRLGIQSNWNGTTWSLTTPPSK